MGVGGGGDKKIPSFLSLTPAVAFGVNQRLLRSFSPLSFSHLSSVLRCKIIPYQPPLPPKPSISSKIIPPSSKLPPLIHPLPQKPHSRHQSPSYPSQLHQSKCGPISYPIDQERRSGLPIYTNDFDSELAALSNMTIEATAIASPATGDAEQQQHVSSGEGLKTGPYKFPPREYGPDSGVLCT